MTKALEQAVGVVVAYLMTEPGVDNGFNSAKLRDIVAAALDHVAAEEREACAKACENLSGRLIADGRGEAGFGAMKSAMAIRARGSK